MDITALLALADEALKESDSGDVLLARINAYADAFGTWFAGWNKEKPITGDPLLQELQTKHQQVLTKAESFKGKIKEDLRGLKKRGKGILVYTDSLPKSLGTVKPRKF